MKEAAQKRGRGRPRSITDMRAYKAQKQREYRARKKLEPLSPIQQARKELGGKWIWMENEP